MHRAIHRAGPELPLGGECNAVLGDPNVIRDDISPRRSPAVLDGCARGAPDAHVWIHDEVPGGGERQDEPFDELDRELTWMDRFLHVVGLHVGEDPQVAGVLSQGVSGVLAGVLPLPGSLARVLLADPNGIEVEPVRVPLGEPQDHLVSAREALRAVQPVLEVPDAAAQLRARLIPSTPCDPKLTRARRAGGGTPRSVPTSARARRSARVRSRTPPAPARPARARSARPPREAPPRRGGQRGRAPAPPDRAPPGSGARRRAGRSRAGPRARVRSDGRAPCPPRASA